MRSALAILLVTVALGGCFGGGDDDPPASSSSSSTTTGSTGSSTRSSSTSTSSGPGGQSGSIELNFTRATPNGAAPLTVDFNLNATFRNAQGQQQAAPASLTWTITLDDGNQTAGPTGTTLPAAFNMTFDEPGNVTVLAVVAASGFGSANDTILVTVTAPSGGGGGGGGGGSGPLFFDGAEGDDSQWTITSNIWLYDVFTGAEEELPVEHPEGTWTASTAQAHSGTKSWYSLYPDNYRTRMQAISFDVPAGGATLSYWVKGGAEANDADGLHVLVNGAEAILHVNVPDWTRFEHDVPAGPATILFRFDSDLSCSNEGPPSQVGGFVCGAGYTLGGLYVDDITVTAK